ncbi:MAG: helix-turn-helix domain-containing protein [Dehalococcoidia bacterium]
MDYALRSQPIQVFFQTHDDEACISAARFFADALRQPNVTAFIQTAKPQEMRAAARLFAVALEAEPIRRFVFSRRTADRNRAIEFVECSVQILAEDFRPVQASENDISTAEAAEILGLQSVNTVKAWIGRGLFPRAKATSGGHWRLPRADVEAFARQRKAAAQWAESGVLPAPRGQSDTDL